MEHYITWRYAISLLMLKNIFQHLKPCNILYLQKVVMYIQSSFSLSGTSLGPALSFCLREVSVL